MKQLRSREPHELNQVLLEKRPEYTMGMLTVANLAGSMFNRTNNHRYDMTDCILSKLNLLGKNCRIRRKP